jgi:hypothetical protein
MRFIAILAAGTFVLVGQALAQGRVDYVNSEYRFSISFPAEPEETSLRYAAANGVVLPCQNFLAATDNGQYSVSVAIFPEDGADATAEFENAAASYRARGTVRYEGATDYDDIPVYEINMTGNDGRQIMASFILYQRYFYIVESRVSADAAPPMQFQHSISPLDANGQPLLQ